VVVATPTNPVVRSAAAEALSEAERLLLARDLHDVVSHTIAAIGLQAGVALHLLGDAPERAAESLHAIRAASREALHELGDLLARLREPDEHTESHELPLTARLAHLAEQTTAAGAPTRLVVVGAPRALPHAMSQALYRVAQESLTNVLRHSRATSAVVSVAYGDDLVLEIVDDGVGEGVAESPGSGLGLVGMRERVDALGGSIEAGPVDGGGFRVHARVPHGGPA
jgi:signal transduction histidine kinase